MKTGLGILGACLIMASGAFASPGDGQWVCYAHSAKNDSNIEGVGLDRDSAAKAAMGLCEAMIPSLKPCAIEPEECYQDS